jgi:protein-disulfide isomerase
MSKLLLALSLAGGVAVTGCSKPGGAPGNAPGKTSGGTAAGAAARDQNAPVAKINGQPITEAELTAEAKGPIGAAEAEHAEKVHGIRSQALDQMIDKRLVEAKAKAEGITPEKLLEREVTSKAPKPTEAEMKMVYEQTKASGRPLPPYEEVKDSLTQFLTEQKTGEAKKAFFDKLRTDAKVEKMLPPLLMPKVEVAAEGPSKGEANAPITIVEFSDFECPFCSRAEASVKQVMETYKGKVRLFFRDYPLPFHGNAVKASEAAHCAGDQGKYWEMHEKLFANQQALGVPQLKEHAKGIGLDAGKFDKCLDSGEKAKLVEAAKKAGEAAGVTGTPAFFINGRPLSGAQPFEKFKEVIDAELAAAGK